MAALTLASRAPRKAALATSLVAFHLFYVPVLARAPQLRLGLSELTTQGVNALLLFAGLALVWRLRGRLRAATLALNLLAFVVPLPSLSGSPRTSSPRARPAPGPRRSSPTPRAPPVAPTATSGT